LNVLDARLNISNQTIAAAAANVQMARATVRIARSQFYPVVSVQPGVSNARVSTGFGRSIGSTFTSFALPLDASWEPDLWGRVRNTVKSARFAAEASVADLEAVRLAAQAELAADYFDLRAQDTLQQVLDATVVSYQDALDITRDRYTAGLESDEAVAQAETQLAITRAQATNLGVLRAQYEHAIAMLCGAPASTFAVPAGAPTSGSPDIPAGLPSELLERRPDIAAAERAVAEANAKIGLAQSAYFPVLSLAATAGFESLSLPSLLTWPSRFWSVGPTLAQTIFDGGLRRATVQQVRASYDQTVATYRQTVLTAFQQVEDNLAALRILAQVIEQQDAAVASAERTLQEAEVRYASGLDPYLNVIIAQAALLTTRQTAVTLRGQRLVASVQLIKALGGGWDRSQMTHGS
jgi:NodT family efflux transporter outer membrane factor (OMF) lipoprotein